MIRRCRINIIVLFITILFLGIIGRLYYLQIVQKDDLIVKATRQRAINTTLKMVRGNIYDRNMISFTDTEQKLYIIVIPNYFKSFEKISQQIAELTGYSVGEISAMLEQEKPVTFIVDHYSEQDIDEKFQHPGVKLVRLSKRYGEKSLARHIIGYVNDKDQIGYSGIEKVFDKELTVNKSQSIGMIGDAIKRSIPGLGYRVTNCFNEHNNTGVRLTLDYHIQESVEDVLDKEIKSGAVVVTDIKTGDVLALASRPNYSQNNITLYIDSEGSELVNKALSAYDLGSVFKIIVAAAALEQKVVTPQTLFHCTGSIDVDGKQFNCSISGDGHGRIDFIHAFAYSCNSSFIDVGLKTGYKPIVNMARRFGFGKPVELFDGLQQQSGYIPDNRYVSPREIANISIGQGEILVTPIQVVDMVTTIANNGVRKKLNIVDALVNDEGNVIQELRKENDTRIIHSTIAKKIQKMMQEVTISGTGKKANLQQYGGAAGKTGSAETGWVVNGQTKVHAWFAGYFPVDNPKYAMVVFVENGRWGGSAAAPIFGEIAKRIMQLNR